MNPQDLLFIGTHGHVRAVSKRTGRKQWETSLPGTGYTIVSLLYAEPVLYAASRGLLFALDPLDGEIVWQNGLRGMGHDHIVLATTSASTSTSSVLHEQAEQDEQQRQSSSTTSTMG